MKKSIEQMQSSSLGLLSVRFLSNQKLLILLTAVMAVLSAHAYDFEVDGIYYNEISPTEVGVTYKSCTKYSGSIIIPATISCDGTLYSVTSIDSKAFYYCNDLSSVVIPNSVKTIGSQAFNGCKSLTTVTIPNSVTSIGNSAFEFCRNLTSVTILSPMISIGRDAFSGTALYYDGSNWDNSVLYIDNHLIEAKQDILRGDYTIKKGTLTLASYAFYNCSGLTTVTIPNSVTSIGNSAFSWCSGLTSVTIPNSVTSIGNSAFSWCSGLTSVTIPESVTSIGESVFSHTALYNDGSNWDNSVLYIDNHLIEAKRDILRGDYTIKEGTLTLASNAFYHCSGLTSVTIPNSVMTIGDSAFSDCSGLTTMTIPNSVTLIGMLAFSGCSGLTSVTIPNSVKSIGNDAFSHCSNLTSVTIPESVSSINYGTFSWCSGLTSVSIPESVTSIGGAAFKGCGSLTTVTIPNSVTSIGDAAFWGCSGLATVNIPTSVTSIGDGAFSYCISIGAFYGKYASEDNRCLISDVGRLISFAPKGLSSYTIPNSVTSIGYAAFASSGLTSVTIPNSVTSIGDYAFRSCSGLTMVDIPNSVTSISDYAFLDCSGLASVTIPSSVTTIGRQAFSNTALYNDESSWENGVLYIGNHLIEAKPDQLTGEYVIKEGTLTLASCAFYKCRGLTSVTIPNSVSSISYAAFASSGLTSVTIPNSVTSISESAFNNCGSLMSVTIPSSVTSIGDYAFSGYSVSEVWVSWSNPEDVGVGTHWVFDGPGTLYVPIGTTEKYKNLSPWDLFREIKEYEPSLSIDAHKSLEIRAIGNSLRICGTDKGVTIQLYSLDGKLLSTVKAAESETIIPLNVHKGEIFIIRYGDKSIKYKF